ncbi:MAG: CRTAC1 family protein [Candidatus Sumerlaeota bacterium]|nr:CRTAC1 family protein [Candidatus Sumerlaeota bacterium]
MMRLPNALIGTVMMMAPLRLSVAAEASPRPPVRFDEVSRSAGVWRTGIGWGVSWADIDGDGDMDLLQPSHDLGDPFLYLNNGDGTFQDISDRIPVRPYADHHVWRWADVNNDGYPDLTNGVGSTGGHTFNYCEVFLNDGKGGFRDVTDELQLGGKKKRGRGITWADVDNDGRLDALITAHLPVKMDPKYEGFRGFQLFLQKGGQPPISRPSASGPDASDAGREIGDCPLFCRFEDASDASGLHHNGHSYWCAPGDFDGDGDIDLFVEHLTEPWHFYENLGGAKFRDITERLPFAGMEWLSDVEWVDYDGDGDLDLYLSRGPSGRNATTEGYHFQGNQAEFFFERADRKDLADEIVVQSKATHFELRPCEEFKEVIFSRHMFRPTPGEIRLGRQAKPAKELPVYVKWRAPGEELEEPSEEDGAAAVAGEAPTDLNAPTIDAETSPCVCIWRPEDEAAWHVRFIRGEERGSQHFSAGVVLNAPIEAVRLVDCEFTPYENHLYENQEGEFVDVSETTGLIDPENTGDALWQDFDNDGDLDLLLARVSYSCHGAAPLALFDNQGDGRFVKIEHGLGLDRRVIQSRAGVACADYNNDGYLDVVVGAGISNPPFRYGESMLFRSQGGANHWLRIRLRGTQSNADGIGAWVYVEAAGKKQTRYHIAGQSFEGQDTSVIHFGLGTAAKADAVTVRWPSGKTQTLKDMKADQEIAIREE